jgi:hypothetical protein
MIQWLVVRAEHAPLLPTAFAKAWSGGQGLLATLPFPVKKEVRRLSFAWSEGARARRGARWPDLLADWNDIYDEKLFPSDELPVLGEELSGLGADVLVLHGEPGLTRATVAWYVKGALHEYDHVGGASVTWRPGASLSRPFDGTFRSAAAAGGRKLAELVGDDRTASVLDRVENANAAIGETLTARALHRLLDADAPPLHEIAGSLATAPGTQRLRLP